MKQHVSEQPCVPNKPSTIDRWFFYLISIILLALPNHAGGQGLGQTFTIDIVESMLPGKGYDKISGDVLEPCITFERPEEQFGTSTSNYSITRISSQQELADELAITASMQFRIGLGQGSLKAKYVESQVTTKNSIYIMAKATIQRAPYVIKNVHFVRGKEDLYRNNPEEFRKRCGDGYVSAYIVAGEFFGVLQIDTQSDEEKRETELSLKGSYGAFSAGGSFAKKIREISDQKSTKVVVFQSGPEAKSFETSPEEFIKLVTTFPSQMSDEEKLKKNGVAKVVINGYRTLAVSPQLSPLDIEQKSQILEKLGRLRLLSLSNVNEIDYVLMYPNQFESSVSVSALSNERDRWGRINERIVMAARNCMTNISQCIELKDLVLTPPSLPKRVQRCNNPEYKYSKCDVVYNESEDSNICGMEYNEGSSEVCGSYLISEASEHPDCGENGLRWSTGDVCTNDEKICSEIGWTMDTSKLYQFFQRLHNDRTRFNTTKGIIIDGERRICYFLRSMCQHESFGKMYNICNKRYYKCRNKEFQYSDKPAKCRNPKFGVEYYKACQRPEFGIARCNDSVKP